MFGLIKKIFIGLLTGLMDLIIQSAIKHLWFNLLLFILLLIYILMNIAKNFTSIHLISNFTFIQPVELDRSVGSCDTRSNSSNEVCVANKTEDLSLRVFSIITRIN